MPCPWYVVRNLINVSSYVRSCVAHDGQFLSWNHGQTCCAGSRIFVHSKIYDEFLERFTEETKSLKIGDSFASEAYQCPQVSKAQFDVSRLSLLGINRSR